MAAVLQLNLRVSVSAKYRPKIIVVSHERSGTHFLMNSLAANFGYIAEPWLNLDLELGVNFHSPEAFERLMTTLIGQHVRNVAKSHHEYGFFAGWIENVLHEYKIIYVHRAVEEVMVSYQRYLNAIPWHEGPKCKDLRCFIGSHPVGLMLRYQMRHAESLVQRWCNHVNGWLDASEQLNKSSFLAVSYTSLNERFSQTMQRISEFLGIELPDSVTRPSPNYNVILPNSPDVASYSELYGPDGLEYLNSIAAKSIRRISEQWAGS